jgi:HAMP domain-containing protein
MLEKATGRPRHVSPRDATVRRHFYSIDVDEGRRDVAVEEVLSVIENAAAPMIQRLLDGEDRPVRNDRLTLAMFLAVCWLRTPVWREETASVMEQTAAAMMAESYRLDPGAAQRALADSAMTADEIEAFRQAFVEGLESGRWGVEFPQNLMIRYFLEGVDSASWVMFMLDWTVVRLDDESPDFIVADNPVSLYDRTPALPGGGGGLLSSPEAQVFVPLAPRTGLLLESNAALWQWARDHLESFHGMTHEERTEIADDREGGWAEGIPLPEFVEELNLRSYAAAERYIFGTQRAVTDVHRLRRTRATRLAQVAPRGPRMHIVADDPGSPTGLRIVRTFSPNPRE